MTECEKFEQFLRESAFPVLPTWVDGRPYKDYTLEKMWAAWQASRRAALEEAAKICDAREDWYVKDDCRGQACAVAGCAKDIRAITDGDKQ